MIADIRLLSTASQRRRWLACCRRWQSFAPLPTDCWWGANAAMNYGGCILIPLQSVHRLLAICWSIGWTVGLSMKTAALWLLEGITVGFMCFPSFVVLVHKSPSYVECTRYSCILLLIYVQVLYMARNTIHPWFPMLHQAPPPPRWTNFCSNGPCVFWPCMCTGWELETSTSDHYWWRYEVNSGWFLGGFGVGRHQTCN
jgi:hypothetical protein